MAGGMVDNTASLVGSTARLEMLIAQQRAWRAVSWATVKLLPLLDSNIWKLRGGVLAQILHHTSLTFRQLPSIYRGIKEKDWSINLGFNIRAFAVDPTQDLLVAIEVQEPAYGHISVTNESD